MTKAAQREMYILRTQTLGTLMDILTGEMGERLRALAWEIAEAVAEQRTKVEKEKQT
jgi:hypothetical protein